MDVGLAVGIGVVVLASLLGVVVRALRSRRRGPRRGPQRPVRRRLGEIALTEHARQRMAQRSVQRAHLELVVRDPEREAADDRQGSIRLERDFGTSTLKVWVLPTERATDRIVVKTTAWTATSALRIPRRDVGRLIGRGGERVRALQQRTGARISVRQDGRVTITGDDPSIVEAAERQVRAELAR